MKTIILLLLFILLPVLPGFSWEQYDSVLATVNDTPIIESDVDDKYTYYLKAGQIKRRGAYGKSRALDSYIERALIKETANSESLIISDLRVIEQMKNIMKPFLSGRVPADQLDKTVEQVSNRLHLSRQEFGALPNNEETHKHMKDFMAHMEKENKMPFEFFFEEVRSQLMREMVMSVAIGMSPPSQEEARAWYNKHRNQLGQEVNVQHILIRPKGKSFSHERDANDTIAALRARVLKGESFDALAAQYSEDRVSGSRGGHLGWVMLQELDPYFANTVHKMNRTGTVSQVFKSSFGYHIVKLLGKRNISFERVENLIMMKLYSEKMQDQFNKWVEQKKERSDIKIHMANYVKE